MKERTGKREVVDLVHRGGNHEQPDQAHHDKRKLGENAHFHLEADRLAHGGVELVAPTIDDATDRANDRRGDLPHLQRRILAGSVSR